MSDKVAELGRYLTQDDMAAAITNMWVTYNNQRRAWLEEKKEIRDYVFATDTSTTSNGALSWKNSTTLPKLCQIRDNLHSNYLSALFPNDNWLRWQGYSMEDSLVEKAENIEAYMSNKTRIGGFRSVMSKCLLDYIDTGMAFGFPAFENRMKTLPAGTVVPSFVGPVARRISPYDIVFNPLADSFENTPKIVRSLKTLGELKKLAMTEPDQSHWEDVLKRREEIRTRFAGYSMEDFDKAAGYCADGFGNMREYLLGEAVEILEFYGDYHNAETGVLETDKIITIVDRCMVVRDGKMPEWYNGSAIVAVGWRDRPDNLWAMGPLDNLIGLQYRLDHLENLKADAMDLLVHPMLKVIGRVEEFSWEPGGEIHVFDNASDVQEMGMGTQGVFAAAQDMQGIEDHMELYAGAPREAMGVRSPGEKTAFEVQELSNAGSRIFQEKITHFEIEFMEKLLNMMLETAQRNMEFTDVVRVYDNDVGAEIFKSLTVDDITANGLLRPVGARHFAKKSQDLQNLTQVLNTGVGQIVAPHTSALEMTRFINDTLGLSGYEIFKANVAIEEQKNTQTSLDQAQNELVRENEVDPI